MARGVRFRSTQRKHPWIEIFNLLGKPATFHMASDKDPKPNALGPARKWHRVFMRADNMSDSMQVDEVHLEGFKLRDFKQGTVLNGWRGEGYFRCTDPDFDGIPDDALATPNMLPVYSERLQNAIRDEGIGGIQFLPVDVFSLGRGKISGYAIANILNVVDALDLQRSSYMVYDDGFPEQIRGKIKWVSDMILKGEVLQEMDICWLRQYPVAMCVSGRFAKMFKRGKFTGIKFSKPLVLS